MGYDGIWCNVINMLSLKVYETDPRFIPMDSYDMSMMIHISLDKTATWRTLIMNYVHLIHVF